MNVQKMLAMSLLCMGGLAGCHSDGDMDDDMEDAAEEVADDMEDAGDDIEDAFD